MTKSKSKSKKRNVRKLNPIPRTWTVGGKRYNQMSTRKTKADARKIQKRQIKKGKNARLKQVDGKWVVYARKSTVKKAAPKKPRAARKKAPKKRAPAMRRRKGVHLKKGDERKSKGKDKGKKGGSQVRDTDPKAKGWTAKEDKKKQPGALSKSAARYPGKREASVGHGRANQYGPSKGGIYYEKRQNRSDKDKRKRL